ncbi:hypothetical protein D3C78_1741660 [compost metagenome]
MRPISCQDGHANDAKFQVFQLRTQYWLLSLAGIHQARISATVTSTVQGSQRLHFHSWLRG